MIFQGLEFTGHHPFKNVLIHGLVRAEDGMKMSKSLGNGVDPMDVIEKYGADALRWFLATGSTPGQDIRYNPEKLEAAWNFINKIWNASRFALMNLQGAEVPALADVTVNNLINQWILTRLNDTIAQVTRNFDKFEFGEAGRYLYHFIWDEFCDWYIEMSKGILSGTDGAEKRETQAVLAYVLDGTLRLLHPIMPFVTEEIWQHLPVTLEAPSISVAAYPKVQADKEFKAAETTVKAMISAIRAVRNARSENNVKPKKPIAIQIKCTKPEILIAFEENREYLERFMNPESLTLGADLTAPEKAMTLFFAAGEIYLPLEGLLNIDEELARLHKEVAKWEAEVQRVEGKLSNTGFVNNAPEKIVNAEREKGEEYQKKLAATKARIEELKQ